MINIGIVGNGFVGSAVSYAFSPQTGCDGFNIRIYDKNELKSMNTLREVMDNSSIIFVSVPTPSNDNGSINLDIVHELFNEMNILNKKDNVILLRSTVIPGSTRKLQDKYTNLNIVFNPEFLTERSARFDFISQSRIILGGESVYVNRVMNLYKMRFGNEIPFICTDYETSEMIKYMNNCYFATKISFLNEMYKIADKSGVNWEDAIEGFLRDGRIGHSHMSVPGPDGNFGFGGSCFPKDIRAMISYAKKIDIEPHVLNGTWKTNLEVRPEKDWNQLKGRSVVDD